MLADQPTSIPHSLERMKEPNTAPATPPTTSFVDKGYRMTESASLHQMVHEVFLV